MTYAIDAPTLEAAIVRQCSPTLAGLKPAGRVHGIGNGARTRCPGRGKKGSANYEQGRGRVLERHRQHRGHG